MPLGKLELDFEPDYMAWKKDPNKKTMSNLLTKIQPAIDRGVSAHIGRRVSPVLKSHARRLGMEAIRSYQPHEARLSTHVINRLKGLKRIARKQQNVLSVPERVSLDQGRLFEAETELEDRLGRTASTMELADHTGLSTKRITHIRKFRPAISEGSILTGANQEQGIGLPAVETAPGNAVVEAIYGDLDPVNQQVLEWTLGLHGQTPLPNKQIAAKLNLTPGAISQRKLAIQKKLDELQQLSIF